MGGRIGNGSRESRRPARSHPFRTIGVEKLPHLAGSGLGTDHALYCECSGALARQTLYGMPTILLERTAPFSKSRRVSMPIARVRSRALAWGHKGPYPRYPRDQLTEEPGVAQGVAPGLRVDA